MKKRDLIIICAVLALALACAAGTRLLSARGERDMVLVYLNGELYGAYPLEEERTVRIEQAGGAYNQIRITGEGVYMEDANCDNHDCMRMGELTAERGADNALPIVCLPHRVSVELVPAE